MEPNKRYRWQPTDTFEFTGNEFAFQYQLLNNLVNTPEFQQRIKEAEETTGFLRMHKLLQEKLDKAIETGIAVPDENEGQE